MENQHTKEENVQPLLSVIVPIYNVEEYLDECLQSIVNQTYRNLEIILVDDGSPDRCPEICDRYSAQDPRIRVIHKPNGGVSSARNAGLDVCTGEYVTFPDPDDKYSSPQMLEHYMEVLVHHQQVDVLHFPRGYFNGFIEPCPWPKGIMTNPQSLRTFFVGGHPNYGIPNRIFRGSIIKNYRFRTDYTVAEDVFVWLDNIGKVNCAYIADQFYYVIRTRPGSLSRSLWPAGTARNLLKAYELVCVDLERYGHTVSDFLAHRCYYGLVLVFDRFCGDIGELKENLRYTRQYINFSIFRQEFRSQPYATICIAIANWINLRLGFWLYKQKGSLLKLYYKLRR